ncbi:MAG: Na(+)/H(+) antiporter subunit D [Alphaproteobacteria bacterium]|jgi:multicomponent Na+:H+ antiporter subunit D|nr:Na(+)/H(+) antiporter subunit D [Alphaproteobacteria bacterium]MDP6589766.1 Na(+)/H(+) antiporter subunit D [Alphaproteobacteria bacterium]MDP6818397.1 Na(+)/H(+) antiporter subunit D [Alphaproteobacteria bacterium]
MTASLPPALIFFAGALLVALAPGRLRPAMTMLVPLVGGWNLWHLAQGGGLEVALFDIRLELVRADKLALLFGILFHLATFLACLYALHLKDRMQQVSALIYAGGALGAVFAGDLITLFVAWEIMAVASVFLIFARRTPRASAAGLRYLTVQISSGLLLLAGALLHISETGSPAFGAIGLGSLAGILIFTAFGIKCAFPLVHSWLTDAYPESTPTGMVFLASFTTKVAVYGLARGFAGTEVLIYIGVAMTMFPIFFAVIENDLRRVLAFSLINQVGFMVVGIGIGSELALNGAVSHAFNDVLFKGLLLMSMGAVLHQTGKINGSELGGLFKTMPVTTGLCIVGAASISAFPLFSGFVSKSMVMVAAAEEGYWIVWLLLLFASAGVFHHAGIKIPYFAFFAHDSGIRTREPPLNMLLAMGLSAALCVLIGVFPSLLYGFLPWQVHYVPYTADHVLSQLQLLFFSALAFAWLNFAGLYPPELRSLNLDADWLYRRLGLGMARRAENAWTKAEDGGARLAGRGGAWLLDAAARHYGPAGILARTRSTGMAALWIVILLGICLILYYL